jgi:ATP-dependent helicase/nuclease subunit B
MLNLLLTTRDGGTAWRHLLSNGEARAGWECVGPLGLARRVGRILGLPAEPGKTPDRLAAFATRLDHHDNGHRSYSESRRTDAFGVASHLLTLRDRLRDAGWRGQPLRASARLADLSALEASREPPLPPGLADVLDALALELLHVGTLPVPLSICLAAPRHGFVPALLRLLDALRARGATIEDAPKDVAASPASTDLGRLQRTLLGGAPTADLTGDGTFLLLEADTALEAAEVAAAALAQFPLAATTVIPAAEAGALDAALARQGLPTLGVQTPSPLRPHLQVLPLRLALAFRPRDAFRAAELLMLPGAPLPGHARRALLDALDEMPGIGSPAWKEAVVGAVAEAVARALAAGASAVDADTAGRRLADGVATWFGGEDFDPVEGIPSAHAAALCEKVAQWAGARAGSALEDASPKGAGDAALWSHAAAIARTLQRMLVARPPKEKISQLALAQLHDLAVGTGTDFAAFEAEAGRPAVCGAPGDVLAAADAVLWFGFVDGSGMAPDPWTEAERFALAEAGLAPSAAGEVRAFETWTWRRPLLEARSRAVLVRWRLAGAGPLSPHPLLDEVRTHIARGGLDRCTLGSERLLDGAPAPLTVRTCAVPPAAAVAPRAVWKVAAAALAPSGTLSATALESLLGCPLKWALEHQAALRTGHGVDLPDGDRLLGDLAHRILQDMVLGDHRLDSSSATEADAAAWARSAFDARVVTEATPLVRPGREVERDAARTLVAYAAAALLRHLRAGGWTAMEREKEVHGTFAGHPVKGYVDLTIANGAREALLDLKLSGARYRRKDLAEGRALQLALYASLLRRGGGPYPPAGYLVLKDGQLLTADLSAFPDATVVDGASAHETLKGAEEGFAYWKKVFTAGVLPAPRDDGEWEGAVQAAAGPLPDADGPARRELSCGFCKFGTVCEVAVGVEEVSP